MNTEGFSRPFAGVFLRFFVIVAPLLLLVDVPRLLGWFLEGQGRATGNAQVVSLKEDQRTFLLKEYETVIQEIRLRLEHEHTMIALKFTLVGAVLGVMLYAHELRGKPIEESSFRSSWAAMCCWAAVVVSAIVDVRRQFNSDVILQLGDWVKSIEGHLLTAGVAGWEQYVGSESSLWNSRLFPVLRLERELVTWATYLLCTTMFVIRHSDQDSERLLQIARLFGTFTYFLFGLYALHFHYQSRPYSLYCASVTIVGVVVFNLWIGMYTAATSDHRLREPLPGSAG